MLSALAALAPGLPLGLILPVAVPAVGALVLLVFGALLGGRGAGSGSQMGVRLGILFAGVAAAALVLSGWTALGLLGELLGYAGPSPEPGGLGFPDQGLGSVVGLPGDVQPWAARLRDVPGAAFSLLGTAVLCGGTLLCVGLSITHLSGMRVGHAEYYALLLLSVTGLLAALSADDLIVLCLGVELAGLPLHALVALDRTRIRSHEAGLKLHLFAIIASAFLIGGAALLYGTTGHIGFADILAATPISAGAQALGVVGLVVGMAIKLGLAPFHQWLPDSYEGAATPVAAFACIVARSAAFLILVRLLWIGVPDPDVRLPGLFAGFAALSLLWGAFQAGAQTSVRRLLGHVAVAQGGVLALALACATPDVIAAMFLGLLADGVAGIGLFGVLITLGRSGTECEGLGDLAGLSARRPAAAAILTVCLLSLAAVPGTIGFVARVRIFSSALGAGEIGLVLFAGVAGILVLAALVRPIMEMYMNQGSRRRMGQASTSELAVIVSCVAVILYFGISPAFGTVGTPTDLLELIEAAVSSLSS